MAYFRIARWENLKHRHFATLIYKILVIIHKRPYTLPKHTQAATCWQRSHPVCATKRRLSALLVTLDLIK